MLSVAKHLVPGPAVESRTRPFAGAQGDMTQHLSHIQAILICDTYSSVDNPYPIRYDPRVDSRVLMRRSV